MLLKLIRIVFCRGERKTRRDDTFNCGVVRKVEEERDTVQTAVLFEILLEEAGSLHVHTHGGEHDGEVVFVAVVHIFGRPFDKACLPHNLSSNLDAARVGEHACASMATTRRSAPHCAADPQRRRLGSSVLVR